MKNPAVTNIFLFFVIGFLVLTILASALFIITDVQAIRAGHLELTELYQEEHGELEQHGRLLLERSALLNLYRLEVIASEELGMRSPHIGQVRVLK